MYSDINSSPPLSLQDELAAFSLFGTQTRCEPTEFLTFNQEPRTVPTFINEFWTSKQRDAHSLHEISYRACFKPQLPRFFIERLTKPGDRVYDPFMGRGTTLIEAALQARIPLGCDINPLSQVLIRPRLTPPPLQQIEPRLKQIPWSGAGEGPEELLVFYHPDTLREIMALQQYLQQRRGKGTYDEVDAWINMVAINRLTGHSSGFFSVYTLPPNQAVSIKSQRRINARRQQVPPYRNCREIILKKSASLLTDLDTQTAQKLNPISGQAMLLTRSATDTPSIPSDSVALVVTSPPFLDVVNYKESNWLRCWFMGIDAASVPITTPRKVEEWQAVMVQVFRELHRMLMPGGHVAFEVGEVNKGKIQLEKAVLPCGISAGLHPKLVLVNAQAFTKTANCWGVTNQTKGTNTNRIVLFTKPMV